MDRRASVREKSRRDECGTMKTKVAVDLTWIRHGIVGGTESYTMNLLDGFVSVADPDIEYIFITSRDNEKYLERFKGINNITIYVGSFDAAKRAWRILWQNTRLNPVIRKLGAGVCIEPIYLKPFLPSPKIKYITTIHDLQAAHYPEFFSKPFVLWMKIGWWNAVHSSDRVIVISEFVKKDILSRYRVDEKKLVLNYDPITIYEENVAPYEKLKEWGAKEKGYYYMVSSLLPHKNIETVIRALGILKKRGSKAYIPLIISGVGGKSKGALLALADESDVRENVFMTPFISEEERNLLYKYCKTYLAPSLFEGFGMPPIEAMIMGAPLLSTYETCSYEVSEGIAEYVDDARDPVQWADKLEQGVRQPDRQRVMDLKEKYSKESIAKVFNSTVKELAL